MKIAIIYAYLGVYLIVIVKYFPHFPFLVDPNGTHYNIPNTPAVNQSMIFITADVGK